MSLRTARVLASAYLLAALVAVTWPAMVPLARIEPYVLGMPLPLTWTAAWISGVCVVLALLDRVEQRHREARPTAGEGEAR